MGDGEQEGREGGGERGRKGERESNAHTRACTRVGRRARYGGRKMRAEMFSPGQHGVTLGIQSKLSPPSFSLHPFPLSQSVFLSLSVSLLLPFHSLSLFLLPPSSAAPGSSRSTDRPFAYLSTCSLTPLRLLSLLFLHLLLLFLFLLPFFCSMPSKKPIYHRTFV